MKEKEGRGDYAPKKIKLQKPFFGVFRTCNSSLAPSLCLRLHSSTLVLTNMLISAKFSLGSSIPYASSNFLVAGGLLYLARIPYRGLTCSYSFGSKIYRQLGPCVVANYDRHKKILCSSPCISCNSKAFQYCTKYRNHVNTVIMNYCPIFVLLQAICSWIYIS